MKKKVIIREIKNIVEKSDKTSLKVIKKLLIKNPNCEIKNIQDIKILEKKNN
ncbi:MAG: hypothetical protein NZZ41_06670 [Candidatus Dojkabacteria bacterium]|nr:hypothetical protein [Candidatus Dojkabacteria bacterium]